MTSCLWCVFHELLTLHATYAYKVVNSDEEHCMPPKRYLGEFEQMVLLAALHLKEDAYGVRLTEEISERSGREVSRG